VNAEFNWWLLIVGLVIGAGLVWLILADSARRESDVTRRERASEARWIAEELRRTGRRLDDEEVADVLDLHALYLAAPPPDEPADDVEPRRAPTESSPRATNPAPADRPWVDAQAGGVSPIEARPPDAPVAETNRANPPNPANPADPSALDWPPRRSPAERPRSDGRDQPSPSRTG
jgi:hypothetical protein